MLTFIKIQQVVSNMLPSKGIKLMIKRADLSHFEFMVCHLTFCMINLIEKFLVP